MVSKDQIFSSKILIIDDQKLHSLTLEKVLKTEGYKNIECVTDPIQAADTFKRTNPDLIILNLIMSKMDGFQVMDLIVKSFDVNYMPILALSDDKNPDVRMKALKSGAMDFIIRPFETIEILTRIHNLIETRLLHLEVRGQNTKLEEKVKERTKELEDTRLDIIQRLAAAAECRDNDTGMHIIRMSRYCERLAKSLKLSDTQCELILNSSPLHDIGKIGIPDSILLKPGRLTEAEFEVMKTHTSIGAKLLSGSSSEIMQMAEVIALTHHEKWDGTGYPKRLKSKNIPLVGQVCSICDVFDALTSKRPYKRAWAVEEAMTEILKQKGKHFNPEMVEHFEGILPDIEIIKKQYSD